MNKSPDAFRTISEVADWLGIQAHVLRFWESKFTQVKPIKRAGGRRYYRPADMLLLGGIKKLLHDDGLTIKGVQKILREEGMTHVSALSQPVDDMPAPVEKQAAKAVPETGVVLNFASSEKAPEPVEDSRSATPDFEQAAPVATTSEHPLPPPPAAEAETPSPDPTLAHAAPPPPEDDHPRATPDPLAPSDAQTQDAPRLTESATHQTDTPPAETPAPQSPEDAPSDALTDDARRLTEAASHQTDASGASPANPELPAAQKAPEPTAGDSASLPGFLRRPLGAEPQTGPEEETAPETESTPIPPAAEADDTPRPAILDLPAFTPEADFPARPGLLSRLPRVRRLPRHLQPQVAGLLLELAEMRQAMDAAMGAETNR